ncbi:MAG: hypothetical protein ACK46Y_18450 [Fluviicola sp.]|jgi:hypothetical protein
MKRILLVSFTLLILFSACTLSGEQENRLNEQLNQFIEAYNNNDPLVISAGTHVSVIKYFKEKGDTAFINKFKQKDDEDRLFFDNPMMIETKDQGKSIQRIYTVEKATESTFLTDEYRIFAVSENKGETWFFVLEEDYYNENIKGLKRLFKKK